MMKTEKIKAEEVEFIPSALVEGVLYHSPKYRTASHLCCCGCGRKVVTPLKQGGWTLSIKDSRPTLNPSVGNWGFPCRSHYWIEDGKIEWAAAFSETQVQRVRDRDRVASELRYTSFETSQSWWDRTKKWIRSKFTF